MINTGKITKNLEVSADQPVLLMAAVVYAAMRNTD